MKLVILIDTETKKNTIKNSLTTQLNSAFASGIVKRWVMDITGVLVPTEDNESYSEG